ncbi:hypothetical protein DRH29_01675 [candidate division Kazan bacterium]|uniref:Uncharacterized protein n=1 Tax=candidate division Kazan bacterium TaxID=2202143 RepID=A0A420ZDA9_UNCK3|nr:MAG: hypothetical protein DRH29_01675 [candidate division Kazan bacterium]
MLDGNTKHEALNTKQYLNNKFPNRFKVFEGLEFVICLEFRISDLEFPAHSAGDAPTIIQAYGFRYYFTPLTGGLFTFPSRYLFTIGLE